MGKTIVERLNAGEVIIGDGGFVFCMEHRGWVKAGPWTPEVAVEEPNALLVLHKEFLRAGANVMQAFTFYASEDKLSNRGNESADKYTCKAVNKSACQVARKVASEIDGTLVAGGLSQTPSYLSCKNKEQVQKEFKKQVDCFVEEQVDFLIAEYFEHVEEAVWAVEVLKKTGLPVACTMCIGPEGDMHGVSCEDVGVQLVRAGADIIGVNCHFEPMMCVKAVELMREGVVKAGLKAHYMVQPLAYHTPDANAQGFIDLPEFPFALEPRLATRWEIQKYARAAYDAGIRYIGGCCGFEPYHIRAVAEELEKEKGGLPPASEKHGAWGGGLAMHTKPWIRARASRTYWSEQQPATGRPYSAAMSKPDAWGITQGDTALMQENKHTR